MLWVRAIAHWGSLWVTRCGLLPVDNHGTLTVAGEAWADVLAGFTGPEIVAAIDAIASRGSEYPPASGQVRMQCFQIPTLGFVRADLPERTHGFTRLVLRYLDCYAFARASQDSADRMLRAAYDHAVERRLNWEPYPAELLRIERTPLPKKADPAHVAAVMREIRGGLYPTEGTE